MPFSCMQTSHLVTGELSYWRIQVWLCVCLPLILELTDMIWSEIIGSNFMIVRLSTKQLVAQHIPLLSCT